ncbi:MAG: hypothetical protein QG657_406 [Acidobacteriota bacterium]|nr:hypothetical protein [Acidobacteriota bacterium]
MGIFSTNPQNHQSKIEHPSRRSSHTFPGFHLFHRRHAARHTIPFSSKDFSCKFSFLSPLNNKGQPLLKTFVSASHLNIPLTQAPIPRWMADWILALRGLLSLIDTRIRLSACLYLGEHIPLTLCLLFDTG